MPQGTEVFKGEVKGTSGGLEKFERFAFMNKLIREFWKLEEALVEWIYKVEMWGNIL